MHILILNSEFPPVGGGAGTASAHIARSMAAMGHRVTVLTTRFADLPRREERDGYAIIRLPAPRRHPHRSSTGEQLAFMLAATLWGLPWTLRLKPNGVLAFFGAPGGVAAWVWSWLRRLPYVVSLRGGDVPGFRPYDFALEHSLLKPLLRRVWRQAAAVVANSQGLRRLAAAFEPGIPIEVIPNGVDTERFAAEPESWSPPRLLFVGRIVYQKGLDILLEALARTGSTDWQLSLVGDGPEIELLRDQALRLGVAEQLRYLGWQDRDSLPALYRAHNLFVYPSRHEGMPNAVLEAMASGLPVVATRIAGNEELVLHERTGLLVPPEDPDALAAALGSLFPDSQRRRAMGAAGRKLAVDSYSWERSARGYLDLFTSAGEKA